MRARDERKEGKRKKKLEPLCFLTVSALAGSLAHWHALISHRHSLRDIFITKIGFLLGSPLWSSEDALEKLRVTSLCVDAAAATTGKAGGYSTGAAEQGEYLFPAVNKEGAGRRRRRLLVMSPPFLSLGADCRPPLSSERRTNPPQEWTRLLNPV